MIKIMLRIVLMYLSCVLCLVIAQTCFDSNNDTGNCINLASCPHLLEDSNEEARSYPNSTDLQTFVNQSLCGFDGFNFLICCTLPTTTQSTVLPPRIGECGISSRVKNRVVGGMEAKKGSYPWIVALGYYQIKNPTFLCGGSLISSTYAITAAHCIKSALKMIRLGVHDLTKTEATAIDVKIKLKIVHEKFNRKTLVNDIALLQLANPVAFTEFISPICLPEDSKFMELDFVGRNAFVAGWGSVEYQGATSDVLRDAQVPIIQTKPCLANYSRVSKDVDRDLNTVLCAGNTTFDACQGDSGGPLMMPLLEGKIFRYYLIGIVSYGIKCARAGFPGIYTRVAAYVQWIKSNMEEESEMSRV